MNNDNHTADDATRDTAGADEREARVLAVVLGEAPPAEIEAVEQLLASDPALRAWRDELVSATLPLLRDAVRPDAILAGPGTAALHLDAARRTKLLETLAAAGSGATAQPASANSIPWPALIRKNIPAFAACAALLLGLLATGVFSALNRSRVTASAVSTVRYAAPEAPEVIVADPASILPDTSAAANAPAVSGRLALPEIAFPAAGTLELRGPDASGPASIRNAIRENNSAGATVAVGSMVANSAVGSSPGVGFDTFNALRVADERRAPASPAKVFLHPAPVSAPLPIPAQAPTTPVPVSEARSVFGVRTRMSGDSLARVAIPMNDGSSLQPADAYRGGTTERIAAAATPAAPRVQMDYYDYKGAEQKTPPLSENVLSGLMSTSSTGFAASAEASLKSKPDAFAPSAGSSLAKNESVAGIRTDADAFGVPVYSDKPAKMRMREETLAAETPFSTFSLNVSDASFRLAAEALRRGQWPDSTRIRPEEFVNALAFNDPPPADGQAVALTQEQARHPFAHNRNLLRLSVQTASAGRSSRQPLNLTLLLDTSGSMERVDRQETVAVALNALADALRPGDTVSLLGFALRPTLYIDAASGPAAAEMLRRIARDGIPPEGGTNLERALAEACSKNAATRAAGSLNRVVLLTDGAANLGDANPETLAAIVEKYKKTGIGIDCYGIGFDGYNDAMLETLARAGYGRYAWLNNPADARDDFAGKLAGALQVAAQNVKVQIEFNPARVGVYRLLGYEKHLLRKEEFRDNTVAAAELGAAESGTAVYTVEARSDADGGMGELGVARVRYQDPATGEYHESEWSIPYDPAAPAFDQAAPGVRLAATAALFAETLAGDPNAQAVSLPALATGLRQVLAAHGAFPANRQLLTLLEEAARLER
ncbi:von Willebrand factor A [Opitutaceae bacterium TAV5]|nr:von Willebrand factor A [Opitutaceae bacterium TAV5]